MTTRLPWVLALVAVAARVVLALATDIYPDEAYYWVWAQRPQLSYFDHPAMVAWGIALLGIRTSAMLFGVLTLLGVYRLTRALGGTVDQSAWALALFASTPAGTLLGTIATPDAPMLAFWVLTLDAVVRRNWVATGVLWGATMLAKYNGVLLGLPVLIAFWRAPLKWLGAGVIALVVTSPTLIWNAANDWAGFRFQLDHGLGGGGGLTTFGEFIGGQFGMAGPVLCVLAIAWLTRQPGRPELKVAMALPLIFFGYASWRARGEANWAAAAWLTASVGVALAPWRRALIAATITNLVIVVIGVTVASFPPRVLLGTPAIRKLHGWAELKKLEAIGIPVITDRYQLSALATFYGKQPATTVGGRRSQYDLWPRVRPAPGGDMLWLNELSGPGADLVAEFDHVEVLEWPVDARQNELHRFIAWRLVHYKGQQ